MCYYVNGYMDIITKGAGVFSMNKMVEKIKKWGEEPLSMKVFGVLVFLSAFFYLLRALCCQIYDSDMYFLIATGKEIVQNGIPHMNVWSIDKSSGFIAQQWLYDVVMYYADKLDYIGFTALVGVQFIVFLLMLNHFFKINGQKGIIKYFVLSVLVFYSELYVFCVRPELITLILLSAEAIALEHYRRGGKSSWLILLPFSMIVEMNVHGSMWFMHYAILLAYMVPAFYLPGVRNEFPLHKRWKGILVATIAMTVSMLINPYGLEGVLYMVKSFTARTFDYVHVVEVVPPEFLSSVGLVVIVGFALALFTYNTKSLSSVSANMTLGILFMIVYASRNVMFSALLLMFLLCDLSQWLSTLTWLAESVKSSIKKNTLPVLLIGVFVFGGYCIDGFYMTFSDDAPTANSAIYDYVMEHKGVSSRMFTGFNNGAYFEYKGFDNVYMDARPELYTKTFTGDKDILGDYAKYCLYGYAPVLTKDDIKQNKSENITRDEFDDWFYSYDFDYIVVMPRVEQALSVYMMFNDDYHLVDLHSGDTSTLLYEKNN